MHREWSGSAFPNRKTKRLTWIAKYLDFDTQKWTTKKGFKSRADAREFLEKMRKVYRAKERGEFDEFAEHGDRPIAEHVEEFASYIYSRRKVRVGSRGEKHSKQTKQQLLDAFSEMKVRALRDLSIDRVQRFLSGLTDRGMKNGTRNAYLASLRHFCEWAEDDERIARNPIRSKRKLPRLDTSKDRSKRQAPDWQTCRALASATIQRPLQNAPRKNRDLYVELGRNRAVACALAYLAAMRNGEIAAARWSWFDLKDEILTVPAEIQGKTGRTSVLPIHRGLAVLLRHERKRRSIQFGRAISEDDLVVGSLVNGDPRLPRDIAERIREAADWIRLPRTDDRGRGLDLHAFRKAFNVNLRKLGADRDARIDLMRHTPHGVTDEHYDDPDLDAMRGAVNMIPAEAAHIAGLYEEPREEPEATRPSEDWSASVSKPTGTDR